MRLYRRLVVALFAVMLTVAAAGCSVATVTETESDGAPTLDRAAAMAQGPDGQLTYTDGTYTVFATTDGEYYSAVYENVGGDGFRMVDVGTEYGYEFVDDDSRMAVIFGGTTYLLDRVE